MVSGLGSIFIFVGRIFISGLSCFLAYLIFDNVTSYNTTISSPLLSCIFVAILGYVVGTLIMSVFGMAMDTILHCFILDEYLNKKNGRDP
jgi:tetrahydromethanopterin S-methyltransferase subunit C